MDDATSEGYSMFFVPEEGAGSSFRGVRDITMKHGLFCPLYTDRGSHYWYTPGVGGKVSKTQLTQFGCAMHHLGIEMIPAYSPEARGRIERAFRTHQDRLPITAIASFPISNRRRTVSHYRHKLTDCGMKTQNHVILCLDSFISGNYSASI